MGFNETRDGAGETARHGWSGAGEYKPLDARRKLRLAGRGAGDVCDLLDEYAGESAGVGGDVAFTGEQSAGVCCPARERSRGSGYGDVAVFLWVAGGLQQTRTAVASGWWI